MKRVRSTVDLRFSLVGAMLGLLVVATASHAEGTAPGRAKPAPVPSFEKLPHTPLPKGEFIAWCGEHERYLLATDRQYVDAYDGGTKISAPSPTGDRSVQCGPDGRYIVFSEDDAGRVRRFELETGKSEVLATFQKRSHPSISFSPNMKIVASSQRLQLTAEAGGVRTINISGGAANLFTESFGLPTVRSSSWPTPIQSMCWTRRVRGSGEARFEDFQVSAQGGLTPNRSHCFCSSCRTIFNPSALF